MSWPAGAISWSRCGGAECIRVRGLAAAGEPAAAGGPAVQVRPDGGGVSGLPAMAGRVVADGGDACFVPRFCFAAGTSYAVSIGGAVAAVLARPRREPPATTEVSSIWPTAAVVPRNLLRLYVEFSAPMSEGYAAGCVRITAGDHGATGSGETGSGNTGSGQALAGALLPAEHELWDGARRRLTVLLDPARIKRGLAAHRERGYPLRPGQAFRLVVDEEFRDAAGARLRRGAERRYRAGADERRRVDPLRWQLSVPAAGTRDPLEVRFGRPLDSALLRRCLRVCGPGGRPAAGSAAAGAQEMSWRFTPRAPWQPGSFRLLVDPVLEDVAGNSVSRVFDRELAAGGGTGTAGTGPAGTGPPAGPCFVIR